MALVLEGSNNTISGLAAGGLPANSVTAANLHSGVWSGKIIQIQQSVKTDFWTRSETTYADIDGTDQNGSGSIWCVKITPSSASSKIWVKGTVAVGGNSHGSINLYRDSTQIHFGDASDTHASINRTTQQFLSGSFNVTPIALDYLDSPNTTSEVTYKLQGGTPHSASYYIYINRPHTQENYPYLSNCASTMTVLEIAA